MKDIIPPVDKSLLEKELTEDKFVRNTNFGQNKIYFVTYHDSPNVLREVGRLRELTFREAGGGTGKDCDLDDFDTMKNPYKQIIVWDPDHKEILGGYRYYICDQCKNNKEDYKKLVTSRLFHMSDKFISDYLPYVIELGRSFVQPKFQATSSRKLLFALDNLWDGLGALVVNNPNIKYFFGKVTMYTHFNQRARNYILYFLDKYFGDKDQLVYPLNPLQTNIDKAEMEELFYGSSYEENYKTLSQRVRSLGENIPPLINSYMNLSPSMRVFGTVANPHFGNVEETGIMITFADMYTSKIERHINSYITQKEDKKT